MKKPLTPKQRKWASEFYDDLRVLVEGAIKHPDSTPRTTLQAIARIFVGVSIGIIGYRRANDVMCKLINYNMEGLKPKK